jgi:dTDP-4-amino-4,6-dideoxygalactose transaminase
VIPRTKVNYDLPTLLRAVSIREDSGSFKQALADRLAEFTGEPNLLLTPSGRGGLYFLLRAIDRPRVIVPSYTCKAVAEAALLAGKEVAYVDVEDDGFNAAPPALGAVAGGDSVVIATHQFGIPCEIEETVRVSHARGALVIEDVAAAFGTRVGGRLAGTFGDAAFYSFDSTKLINVPLKAGFVTAKHPALLNRVRGDYHRETSPMPPWHKRKLIAQAAVLLLLEGHLRYRMFHKLMFDLRGRYTTDSDQVNQRLNPFYTYDVAEWQAYVALGQIERVDAIIAERRRRYAQYLEQLRGQRAFALPPGDAAGEWACIRFPIRVHGDKIGYYRRAARRGVDFAFSFTYLSCKHDYLNGSKLARAVLDLPFYLKLSDAELERVVRVLREIDEESAHECL